MQTQQGLHTQLFGSPAQSLCQAGLASPSLAHIGAASPSQVTGQPGVLVRLLVQSSFEDAAISLTLHKPGEHSSCWQPDPTRGSSGGQAGGTSTGLQDGGK